MEGEEQAVTVPGAMEESAAQVKNEPQEAEEPPGTAAAGDQGKDTSGVATTEDGEGAADDEEEEELEDEDEDEDDDDLKITIDDAAPTDFNLKAKQRQPQQAKPATIDLDAGQAILDVDLNTLEDKPWRKPGADISDYFNYGFDEDTWKLYCDKQKRMKAAVNEFKMPMQMQVNEMPESSHGVMRIPTIVSYEPKTIYEPKMPSYYPPETEEDKEREHRDRDQHRSREREKERSRRDKDRESRDKDRERDRDRDHDHRDREHRDREHRDREKERDREKRDKDKSSRVKDRDKSGRDRERKRERERSHERSRERDRDKKRKRSR